MNESVVECHRKLRRKSLGEMVISHDRTRCENRKRQETSSGLRLVSHCIQFGTLNTTFGRHFRRHWIPSVYCHELSSIMPWPTYVWLRESVTHLYKKKKKHSPRSILQLNWLLFRSTYTVPIYYLCKIIFTVLKVSKRIWFILTEMCERCFVVFTIKLAIL